MNILKKIYTLFGLLVLGSIMAFNVIDNGYGTAEKEYSHIPSKDSTRLIRGERLVQNTCVHCHRGDDGKLSGGLYNKSEPQFGKIYAANITQSSNNGIGNWSEEEIEKLLRTGIKPDGGTALPFMPRFPLMSSEDMDYLIEFLQSDHFLVDPSENDVPDHRLSVMSKLGKWFFPKKLRMPDVPISPPDTTLAIEHGKYLVNAVFHCFSCHSGSLPKINFQYPEKTPNYLMGGSRFKNLDGEKIVAPNVTFNEKDGIGHYSLGSFKTLLQMGQKPDGTFVQFPMQPYPSLTQKEIEVIYAYLKGFKP